MEAWDSDLGRLVVAGSPYTAGMPIVGVQQVSFRNSVPSRRLVACLPVELGAARG